LFTLAACSARAASPPSFEEEEEERGRPFADATLTFPMLLVRTLSAPSSGALELAPTCLPQKARQAYRARFSSAAVVVAAAAADDPSWRARFRDKFTLITLADTRSLG
jgi:hypothetical protein